MNAYFFIKSSISIAWQCVFLFILYSTCPLQGQASTVPKVLFDPTSANTLRQVQIHGPMATQFSTSISNGRLVIQIKAGPAAYPGLFLYPVGGMPWDLSAYGHVDAKITNTGSQSLNLTFRVDNEGYGKPAWDMESKTIGPGQTQVIRVYFGYSNGFHPGYKLNQTMVKRVLFFTRKVTADTSFQIESVVAAGSVGENNLVDPNVTP